MGRLLGISLAFVLSAALAAQPPSATGGAIQGVVTTQSGSIPLGGVLISVASGAADVASVMSDGDGTFRFEGLKPGQYKVTAKLESFELASVSAEVPTGGTAEVALDLRLVVTVNVTAPDTIVPSTGTLTPGDVITSKEVEQIEGGGGVQSALRLLASVIQLPGGLAIKGGLPNQASVQVGAGTFVDPATGLSQARLPDDSVDSVTVLPNPYAVEYGRFSSGLVLIQTRRAGDHWQTRVNNFDPTFLQKRPPAPPWDIIGISAVSPRFETGGPIVKDRVFLEEAAEYRYRASEVASLPQSELRKSYGFSSFTRIDANLSPHHMLVATGGLFPSRTSDATLGTFTPPPATVNTHSGVNTIAVTEKSIWSDTLFSETTVEMNQYQTQVNPQSTGPMQLYLAGQQATGAGCPSAFASVNTACATTDGSFFNQQERTTSTFQLVETVSGSRNVAGGLHQFKAGFDLLDNGFNGSSASEPVLIHAYDGTLVRRLDFGPSTTQSIDSVDLALFVQDRVQPTNRWYIEVGARLDRDGVIDRFNVTPRVGTAVLLDESGSAVLRSGLGQFFERTPSAAGVFESYEATTDTRYAADGVTPISGPVLFTHQTGDDLRTARSLTWDLAYDQRFNRRWAVHIGAIDRRGTHELIVSPVSGAARSELLLDSSGRSDYREAEFGVHFTGGPGVDLNATYVRSQARADLNAFTSFFDAIMWPVVGQNEYAPAPADAPNRLLTRVRAMPTPTWLFIGVLDWRTGLPYSIMNAALDFVGPRNDHRFPTYARTELGLDHRFRIAKFRPWIGVRADNALNAWLPSDVQANTTSPAFGTFYNSAYRQYRIQIRFER